MCAVVVMGLAMSLGAMLFACGGNNTGNGGFSSSGGASSGSSNGSGSGGTSSSGTSSGTGASSGIVFKEDGGAPTGPTFTDGGCAGLQCQIANTCTNDGGTTITGQVMDPAGKNPLYNVLAYVPMFDPADPSAIPAGYGIQPITGGVSFPSGVSCDSCSYLYSGNPIAIGTSDTDGHFTITNAPSGTNIPVVIQVGKWRTHTTVATVKSCEQADAGAINMPGTAPASDPIISMPQIAISMGGADSLECLLPRMGIASSEIVSGAGTGHVHIFSGDSAGTAPASSASMWDSLADLEKYDVSLFSCEGEEPAAADPQTLEQYVNAGGRAFLSHYHYAWLAGPLQGGGGYTANPDWGTHLASWNSNDEGAGGNAGTLIDTTLNVGGGSFAKGVALKQWLTNVDALGASVSGSTPPAGELEVISPAFDPNVTSADTPSQPWATYDSTAGAGSYTTAYFSFNTPVGAVAPPDGGAAPYCGRVVFSGLHVGGAQPSDQDDTFPALGSTCTQADLSPQEKVLEFMIFDLSACVIPDTATPGIPIPPPPPPPAPQ
jgi:hypothetical protein